MKRPVAIFLALLLSMSPPASAQELDVICPNARIFGAGLFTKVCWSAMFPMKLAGITIFHSQDGATPPEGASTIKGACFCGGDLSRGQLPTIGFPISFWQPARIMEVTKRPYCFPAMGGISLPSGTATAGGRRTVGGTVAWETSPDPRKSAMYNWNYYTFPLFAMLKLMDIPGCNTGGFDDFDLMQMSAFFPNWYKPGLSFLINPEVLLFSNPVALSALPVDCAAVMTGKPLDKLFWAVGCWGGVYPFDGFLLNNSSPVQGSSLIMTRAMSMMARLPASMVLRTTGNDAICQAQPMPLFKKTQFRAQMMFPIAEARGTNAPPPAPYTDTTSGGTQVPEIDPAFLQRGCAHWFGQNTLKWGEWRTRPATGEDFVYMVWQWTDCCMGAMFSP